MSRQRSSNFSSEEKGFLTELIQEKGGQIENPKSDIAANQRKSAAWNEIAHRMSAQFPAGGKRSVKQVKDFWKRAKIKAKKEISEMKKSAKKTGGGPKRGDISQDTQVVIDLIGTEAMDTPPRNAYDDDGHDQSSPRPASPTREGKQLTPQRLISLAPTWSPQRSESGELSSSQSMSPFHVEASGKRTQLPSDESPSQIRNPIPGTSAQDESRGEQASVQCSPMAGNAETQKKNQSTRHKTSRGNKSPSPI